jgi:hypothetical protein
MDAASRAERIRAYVEGPAALREALAEVPAEAMRWRPGRGRWSVHEVVVHCADSAAVAYARLRYVLAEDAPLLVAYDQDRWAERLDYESQPLAPAVALLEAVHAATVPLLERLPEGAWSRAGRHTETGPYRVDDWLRLEADHLQVHARQIRRNLEAWRRGAAARRCPGTAVPAVRRIVGGGRAGA